MIEEGTSRTVAVAYDKADAPLLAAAPDMLSALKGALAWLSYGVPSENKAKAVSVIEAAISNAEGTR